MTNLNENLDDEDGQEYDFYNSLKLLHEFIMILKLLYTIIILLYKFKRYLTNKRRNLRASETYTRII